PSTRSSAATKCISEVPGLAKHTLTPPPTKVRTRLSAPFIRPSPILCHLGACLLPHAASRRPMPVRVLNNRAPGAVYGILLRKPLARPLSGLLMHAAPRLLAVATA